MWLVLILAILGMFLVVFVAWLSADDQRAREYWGTPGFVLSKTDRLPDVLSNVIAQVANDLSGDGVDIESRVARPSTADYSQYRPVPSTAFAGIVTKGALPEGYLLLAGGIGKDGRFGNTAVLLKTPSMELVSDWSLVEQDAMATTSDERKVVHGIDILPDGSVIYAFNGGNSLTRKNSCDAMIWATKAKVHHAVSWNPDTRTIWSPWGVDDDEGLAEFSATDGSLKRVILAKAIIAADATIDPLGISRTAKSFRGKNTRSFDDPFYPDPFHFNDIEPLTSELADAFPRFDAGDLLVSARSVNLVFVLDPDTSKIKWWRNGATIRQHDADWLQDGRISVYNNRMSRGSSSIIALDPDTMRKDVLVDGARHDFYSRIRGKQQMLPGGTVLVTSTEQGQAFAVDASGKEVFALANTVPGETSYNHVLTEARWLPPRFFSSEKTSCKSAS